MPKYIHKKNIQFKNYIGTMDKRRVLGVALDTAKTFHRVVMFDFNGRIIRKPFSIDVLKKGYGELKKNIKLAEKQIKAERVFVSMETPAKYTMNLVEHLERDFGKVAFIPPTAVADNRKQKSLVGLKSDDIDAAAVGDLLIRGEFSTYYEEKEVYQRLRNLVYWRQQKVVMRAMVKNQINHRIERIYPGMNNSYEENKPLVTHIHRSMMYDGLIRCNKTGEELLSEDDDKLIRYFKYDESPARNSYIRKLKSKFNDMLLPSKKLIKHDFEVLRLDVDLLDYLNEELERVEDEIVSLGQKTKAKFLYGQIKGISDVSIAIYVGLIGSIDKYKSAGQVYSYAGLNPQRRQSGGTDITRIGISRSGNRQLRAHLFLMARQVVMCNSYFKNYYQNIKDKRQESFKRLIVIICRKLNRIMFAMMRDERPFEPYATEARHEV